MFPYRILIPLLCAALSAGCGEALATASTVVTGLQQAQTAIDQTLGSPSPAPSATPSAAASEVPTIFGIPFPGAP